MWGGSGPMSCKNQSKTWTKFIWQISKRFIISWRLKELVPLRITALDWSFWEPELKSLSAFSRMTSGWGDANKQVSVSWLDPAVPSQALPARFWPCFDSNQGFPHHENISEVLLSFCMGMKIKCESSAWPSCSPLSVTVIKATITVRRAQERNRWEAPGRCRGSWPCLLQLHLCFPPLKPNIEYLKAILCTVCFDGYLMFTEELISVLMHTNSYF